MAELTAAQRTELRALLLDTRQSLLSTRVATEDAAGTVHLDQTAVGRVSRIDAIQRQAVAETQKRRNELLLQQIDVALSRFHDDEYGVCKVCGDDIGYPRLSARPESPACVSCMRDIEASRG